MKSVRAWQSRDKPWHVPCTVWPWHRTYTFRYVRVRHVVPQVKQCTCILSTHPAHHCIWYDYYRLARYQLIMGISIEMPHWFDSVLMHWYCACLGLWAIDCACGSIGNGGKSAHCRAAVKHAAVGTHPYPSHLLNYILVSSPVYTIYSMLRVTTYYI